MARLLLASYDPSVLEHATVDARAEAGGIAGLTPRELEVLDLTSAGLTNSEVAGRLTVSVHAVKFHLSSIFRKLEVGNRTEAAAVYFSKPGMSGR